MDTHDGIQGYQLNKSVENKIESNQERISWYHFNYASDDAKKWLKQQSQLSSQARSILLAADTRPRFIEEDDAIIMCLRGINLNKTDSPEDMISIRIWMDSKKILTSSNRESQSIINVQKLIKNSNEPKKTDELLILLIEQLGIITDDFVDTLEEILDREEDSIAGSSFESFNPKMSKIRRQIATIRRYLAPQKEALDKLFRSKVTFVNAKFYDNIYIQIDKFTYILENLDLMRERALVLQEQFNAYISQQQNSRLYLLAIISAIFLPLTFLSGLLGMNVGGMPGVDSPDAFWLVVFFCLIVLVILLIAFKKNKWF